MVSLLIEQNPSLKGPALAVLAHSQETGECERAILEEQVAAQWKPSWRQSVAATTDILARNGLLCQRVLVNGQPYEGTLEDIQLDESIPEDAEAACLVAPTAQGNALLDAYDPTRTLNNLFEDKPAYRDIFNAALAACNTARGATRDALEAAINKFPQLQPDPVTNQTKVYPQYFIDALETAGGIAWDGAWKTTQAGRAALA